MLRQKILLRKNLVIKKTFSLPSPKGGGLFVGFLGCSEKFNSCKATVCNLKVAIYFSDISKLNYNITNLLELGNLNFNGGRIPPMFENMGILRQM